MRVETGTQFVPEQEQKSETTQTERDLNEIIPILAHGLVRRIEQKGFSGKVRVSAMAGNDWGVAKSPDNPTDIPNVIIYPRESLSGDRRLVNARLRHEIGNLNYPIEGELNSLRGWCVEHQIAPELLTSLVESTQEASVNYLEMQNSHSSQPEENFKALYEQELDTQQIADGIGQSAPYKQAVDLTLLYCLGQTGLIPKEQFSSALETASPEVREVFDKQTRSLLDQAVRVAVPKQKIQLIRDFVWPKFSGLVALSGAGQTEVGDSEIDSTEASQRLEEVQADQNPEAAARAQQAKELQEKFQRLMQKMRQQPQQPRGDQPPRKQHSERRPQESQEQRLSPAEQQERKEEENLLAENLRDQLQHAKEQLEQLQNLEQSAGAPKPQGQQPTSLEDIGKQAQQMKEQAEKAMQEAREAGTEDQITEEQLQQLKEQLEQLEEIAKQITESGALEEELAKPDEEPITYNIKEFGIDEASLTPEQLENLEKTRLFAQSTTKTYRTLMRLVYAGYLQRNPNFTDDMMQKMKERGYDLPDFSIYGPQAAESFLSQQTELGINGFSDNFLVNFQLPRPLARFWYRGGDGSKSVAVNEGEIEWGHFYRMAMPAIYNGVDRAATSGLYLNRINQFGQHDPKNFYYLWEAINTANQDQADESDQSENAEESEQGSEDNEGQEQGQESGGQESGDEPGQDEGSSEGAGGAGQAGSQGEGRPGGQMGGGEGGEPGGSESGGEGMPSSQEMQELLSEMQDILDQAKEQGSQSDSGAGQEAIDQMLEQLSQMQESLQSGTNPQEIASQMQNAAQQLSEMVNMQNGQKGQDGGQGDQQGEPGESASGEESDQPHDEFQQGGKTSERGVESLFSRPNEELLKQLRQIEQEVGSKFSAQDDQGEFVSRDMSSSLSEMSQSHSGEIDPAQARQLNTLDEIKRQQQAKVEAMYREMSGLNGEALRVYIEYMESMRDFIQDLTEFFIEKFQLDKEYLYERNQRRGARLQRGFTKNILGLKEGKTVISPRSFERKRPPEKPQFAWSLIIDNSGSCGGEIIEQEKRLATALVEVAKTLDIPLEIVTFGGSEGYVFLKNFEQDVASEDLQKMVLLNADQGTPDVATLRAACTSMKRYADRFRRSYDFVYFMTDGQSGEGSIQGVIGGHNKDMVITGIGLAGAAGTIASTWGKNSVAVPDVNRLTDAFIKKVEEQIDQTFD